MVEAAVVGKAVLDNPEKFAQAAKVMVDAQGGMIQNYDKALDVLTHARKFIAEMTTEHAIIVNLSDKSHEWYVYNDFAPVKLTT
jgi:hypothetical protein